eukprot:1105633-Rhodomonas_salina.2
MLLSHARILGAVVRRDGRRLVQQHVFAVDVVPHGALVVAQRHKALLRDRRELAQLCAAPQLRRRGVPRLCALRAHSSLRLRALGSLMLHKREVSSGHRFAACHEQDT